MLEWIVEKTPHKTSKELQTDLELSIVVISACSVHWNWTEYSSMVKNEQGHRYYNESNKTL